MSLTEQELDELNEGVKRAAFLWRETEMPKIRERMLASGFVTREAVLDNIVSVADLLADPHEIWRESPWWGCRLGYERMEIEE